MNNSFELINTIEQIINTLGNITNSLAASGTTAQEICIPFSMYLNIFIMSCFIGYYVIWKVTPSLHAPLMAVTNAISSVIIVGAILAAGQSFSAVSGIFGFFAVVLASVNIFGGFYVTHRMLGMFAQKKEKKNE